MWFKFSFVVVLFPVFRWFQGFIQPFIRPKCEVKNVLPEEADEWKCDITSYNDGSNKWKSYETTVSKKFNVDVEIKKTTTTTTTTPKPVNSDYIYEYPEVDERSADGSGTNSAQTGKKNWVNSGFNMTYVILIVVAAQYGLQHMCYN